MITIILPIQSDAAQAIARPIVQHDEEFLNAVAASDGMGTPAGALGGKTRWPNRRRMRLPIMDDNLQARGKDLDFELPPDFENNGNSI